MMSPEQITMVDSGKLTTVHGRVNITWKVLKNASPETRKDIINQEARFMVRDMLKMVDELIERESRCAE